MLADTTSMRYIDYKEIAAKNPKLDEIKLVDLLIAEYVGSI